MKGTSLFGLAAGAAAIIALAPTGALAQDDNQLEPFRLIVTDLEVPLVPNSVMELAIPLGYYEAEGVEVELVRVQQTPSAVAALGAGEGDMANIAVDAVLQVVGQDIMDIWAVTSPNKALPFLIASAESITDAAQLEGRNFGVGRIGSLDYSLSVSVLNSIGVDTNSLNFVSLGQPDLRAQALAAGRVDATTMSIGVWLSMPDHTGLHVLVPQDAYYAGAPVVNKVNVVPASVLAERRDVVLAVVRAILNASRDFSENPTLWVDAMAEARPDVDRATLELLGEAFAGTWSVNGGLGADELAYTAEFIYGGEEFGDTPQVGLDAWVDFSILDDILDEVGTIEGMDPPTRPANDE